MGSESDSSRAEVKLAWERAPEALRKEVSVSVQRHDRSLFLDWMIAAKMSGRGLREHDVATRGVSANRARLDEALWLPGPEPDPKGSLAGRVLIAYFTQASPKLNAAFMSAVGAQKLTEDHRDAEKVQVILERLRVAEATRPERFALYLAALRWLDPGWFPNGSQEATEPPSPRTEQVLVAAESNQEEDRESSQGAQKILRDLRRRFGELRNEADEASLEDGWKREMRGHLDAINDAIGDALAPSRTAQEKRRAIGVITPAATIVQDLIAYKGHDFKPLRALLASSLGAQPDLTPGLVQLSLDGDTTFQQEREQVWEHFQRLVDDRLTANDATLMLTRFAKMTHLYASIDETKRVKPWQIPASSVGGLETSFSKPGSTYFESPIRLTVLRGGREGAKQAEALNRSLEDPAAKAFGYVVFSPDADASLRRKLDKHLRQGLLTIIDGPQLRDILEAERVAPRFRQTLRRAISVETASPFKSEGYVSSSADIYVGRKEALDQILSRKCWAVWGGRRSGKTSLLHEAMERAVQRHRKSGIHVTYHSLEGIGTADHGGPSDVRELDLRVAQRIARDLQMRVPGSLEEFEVDLNRRCTEQEIWIFLDEIDAYLEPLMAAGRFDFPVIRRLRAVRNKHNQRLVCLFAGFKGLYRAVELERRPTDTSYPWHNFVSSTEALSRLSMDEATDLVKEGFSDVLGFEFEAAVPQKIFKITGGHPALVQHFCNCLLSRIKDEARNDPHRRITIADVDGTYEAGSESPGQEEPFISFVEKTLDMNLGELERIIVYVIAASMIGKSGDPDTIFTTDRISKEVNEWFAHVGARLRSREEMDLASKYLCMTGMLLRAGDDQLKMAFPSYVDILRRLEESRSDRIESLIQLLVGKEGR